MNNGLPPNYDEWRTRSPEDQEDIDNRWRERREREIDRADYMEDREKDEPGEDD